MLKKKKENTGKNIDSLDGEIYEVERICEEFVQEDGSILYRISWKGYSKDFDTWEPIENLIDCKHALEDWNRFKNSTSLKKKRKTLLNKYTKKKNIFKSSLPEDDKVIELPLKKPFSLKNISKSDNVQGIFKENQINNIEIATDKKDLITKKDKACEFKLENDLSLDILNSSKSSLLETFSTENCSLNSINRRSKPISENKVLFTKTKKNQKKFFCDSFTDFSLSLESNALDSFLLNSASEHIESFSHVQNQIVTKSDNFSNPSNTIVKINEPICDFYKKDFKSSKFINRQKLNPILPFSPENDRNIFIEKLDRLLGPPVFLINEIDSDLSPSDFEFITSYKYGLGVEPRNPMFISGCSCSKDGCDLKNPDSCQCLEDSNNKDFSYDEYGRIRSHTSIIYECNENCDCGIKCPNRVVQRGRKIPLDIFKTKHKGWGLRSPRFIKAGTFIGVYLGELICQSEAEARGKKYDHIGITYLFDLDLFEDQVDDYYTIDAQYCGDVTRFINHSCDPNLAIYTVLRDKSDYKIYDIALFAIKDIPPLEELCFDYSGRNNEDELGFFGNYSNSKYINLRNKQPCYCGSANYKIGDRISFKGNCCTIKYIGPVEGTKGKWLGVEWDDPFCGKHDGTYLGHTYFKCRKKSGSFIRQNKIRDIEKTFVQAFNDKYKYINTKEYDNFENAKSKNINNEIKICKIYYPKNTENSRKLYLATLNHMSISKLGNIEEIKEKCVDLLELDLSGNLLDWETVILIIKELPNLNILKLNFFENLEELQLSHNLLTLETEQDFQFFDCFFHLKKVFLDNNKISCFETVTKIFGKLEKLEFLSLASNQIDNISLAENSFVSLKHLDISKNNISKWSSLDNLNVLDTLVSLRFSDNPLFEDISNMFIIPRLKNIMIINGTKITQEERQNAELHYLYELKKEIGSGKISDYSNLIKIHPRCIELQKKYGEKNFIFKENLIGKNIEEKLIAKKQITEVKIVLGHPSNNLKTGIVGLANVGKSTLFQVITKSTLGNPANFPYATIDPEEARVAVPDERFDWLCNLYKPLSKIPAFLTIFDIAGLTKGASTGAGLGNAFLSHIRAVDAIFQLVRAFDDAEIIHVEGDIDPCRDLQIVQDELLIKDMEFLNKQLEALKRITNRGGQSLEIKANKEKQVVIEKLLRHLEVEKKEVRKGNWTNKEIQIINSLFLLTAKPVIYLINLSEKDYLRQKSKWLPKIAAWIKDNNPGDVIIPISVAFEERLSQMTDQEAQEECKRLGTKSMLSKIVTVGYSALNLIYYFTCGPDEVRAWTIRKGTKAPAAAGVIHTDFEKNFIVGEVMKFEDLKNLGSEAAVKSAGKYMTKGKDYIVEHNDIIYWKAGKK
ncbi:hypothetical protein PMAC_002776 [Pneumocystis sp. 'macacae']|nr:hypothetical protein PMAC_002776 [Pneumocystis sp. 'macacae']